jgi:hypothetical protein
MARSRAGFLPVGAIALVGLIVNVGPVEAGTIVQTVSFSFALHNTHFGYYHQFDPTLGMLTSVEISVSASFSSETIAFQNATFFDTVSYNGFVDARLVTDAGSVEINNAFKEQLSPQAESFHNTAGDYNLFNSYSDVGFWIGNLLLAPFEFTPVGPKETLTFGADDPRINARFFSADFFFNTGGETITYFFQPFGVPEPPSLVLFATAALVLIGLRCALSKLTYK